MTATASSLVIESVTEEWNALVRRERNPSNRILTRASRPGAPSDADAARGDGEGQSPSDGGDDRTFRSCPSEMRQEICSWFYSVVDRRDIDRGVVSVALSYFDRYVSFHETIDRGTLQLASMTSLYLAVKVHSVAKISAAAMCGWSQGRFLPAHIYEMELVLARSLGWHLHPPTPLLYLDVASPLLRRVLPPGDDDRDDDRAASDAEDLARYLLELAACDAYFLDKAPSAVAHAAVRISAEEMGASYGGRRLLDVWIGTSGESTAGCLARLRRIQGMAAQRSRGKGAPPGDASPTSVI